MPQDKNINAISVTHSLYKYEHPLSAGVSEGILLN